MPCVGDSEDKPCGAPSADILGLPTVFSKQPPPDSFLSSGTLSLYSRVGYGALCTLCPPKPHLVGYPTILVALGCCSARPMGADERRPDLLVVNIRNWKINYLLELARSTRGVRGPSPSPVL